VEQLHGFVKIVDDLLLRVIVRVAVRLQSADAGAVLIPFVLPEIRVITSIVFPVGSHLVQEVFSTCVDKDQGYIAVLPV
jgi:hypothetical protein